METIEKNGTDGFSEKLRTLAGKLSSLAREIEQLPPSISTRSLLSHSSFHSRLKEEIERAGRYNQPLALGLIAPDHIPSAPLGKSMSESLLMLLAGQINALNRQPDHLGRDKNNGLVLLLPMTSKMGAGAVCERICENIAQIWRVNLLAAADNGSILSKEELQCLLGKESVIDKKENNPCLTISVGIASYPDDTNEGGMLDKLAKKALDSARSQGGNRVNLYHSNLTATCH